MLVEMVRLDLFKKRYQQAILDEDLDCIEVPGLGDSVGDRPETFVAESQSMRALLDMAKDVYKRQPLYRGTPQLHPPDGRGPGPAGVHPRHGPQHAGPAPGVLLCPQVQILPGYLPHQGP